MWRVVVVLTTYRSFWENDHLLHLSFVLYYVCKTDYQIENSARSVYNRELQCKCHEAPELQLVINIIK